jgi:hypothetical protein
MYGFQNSKPFLTASRCLGSKYSAFILRAALENTFLGLTLSKTFTADLVSIIS